MFLFSLIYKFGGACFHLKTNTYYGEWHYRKPINNWFRIIQIMFCYILRQAVLPISKLKWQLSNYCHVCGKTALNYIRIGLPSPWTSSACFIILNISLSYFSKFKPPSHPSGLSSLYLLLSTFPSFETLSPPLPLYTNYIINSSLLSLNTATSTQKISLSPYLY